MEQQFNYFVGERRPEGNISTSDWRFNKTSEKIVQRSSPNIITVIKLRIRLTTNVQDKEESTGFWKERDSLEDLNINEDNIKMDVKDKEWKGVGWFNLVQNTGNWWYVRFEDSTGLMSKIPAFWNIKLWAGNLI
jgi:hypothetical protein